MNKTLSLFLTAVARILLGQDAAKPVPKKRIDAPEGGILLDVSKKRHRVRRNGPCPCGSGQKFKKCHLPGVRNGEFYPVRPVLTGKTADVFKLPVVRT